MASSECHDCLGFYTPGDSTSVDLTYGSKSVDITPYCTGVSGSMARDKIYFQQGLDDGSVDWLEIEAEFLIVESASESCMELSWTPGFVGLGPATDDSPPSIVQVLTGNK